MKISPQKFKELLVKPGFVNMADFDSAQKQAEEEKRSLEEILVEKGLMSDENLGKLIAEELDCPFVDLREEDISGEVLKTIPELVAKTQQVIAFDRVAPKEKKGIKDTRAVLKIAMTDPANREIPQWLEKKTGDKVEIYYATPSAIKDSLKFYRKEIKEEFADIIETQVQEVKTKEAKAQDLPIIRIVDTLVEYAYENRASDIHVEPLKDKTQIRFRIDGILHNVVTLPRELHDLVVSRIKVLSKLRTDEHFAAQDGKFIVEFEKEKFDIRVSIVPITEGEKVVMRLLSERARKFSLENLGLSRGDLKKVNSAIKKPYGMVLATGPTGCGKTTTLYAVLKILNKPKVNIATIEDPVEYDLEGVNQIQVNPKTNLTFASGLRSIVRQDPDIIMVGEIRDPETASIAINAAMTGHLVLSTMHANTAATNLPRLIDMGVEPFLVTSSVNIIIAQRLVRKICNKCRKSQMIKTKELEGKLPGDLIERLSKGRKEVRIFKGSGCKSCADTGYSGRIGIFEILEVKDNVRKLVMKKANTDEIQSQAIKDGMTTMLEDGIEKVLVGMTTIDEVLRVIRE